MDSKVCNKCGIPKALDEFREVTQQRWTFRRADCKDCESAARKTPEARAKSNERTKRNYRRYSEKIKAKAKNKYWSDPVAARAKLRERRTRNPEHVRARNRAYYAANPIPHRERAKRFALKNREKIAAYMKQYREKHKDQLREYDRRYDAEHAEQARLHMRNKRAAMSVEEKRAIAKANYIRNPGRRLEATRRHEARKRGASIVERIHRTAIITRDNSTCYLCDQYLEPDQITLDHVIPLVRGGSHTTDNLKVACRSCNCKKHTMTAEEYLASRNP